MGKITAILIGAGLRGGHVYASYALEHPDEFQIVAVAEPDIARRKQIAALHKIPEENQYESYEKLLQKECMADCALVCTQDQMHYEPVTMALQRGYHVLCEKPMSPKKEEIIQMGMLAEKYNRVLAICHVLRYSSFYTKLKELLDSGKIGKLMSIQAMESVGFWHHAHSFVRGNWRNAKESSPMILQKCCHDMDILQWLIGKKCKKVQSFGTLSYFKEENAPKDAPDYCIQGCPKADTCPYNAVRLYLDDKENDWFRTTSTREANPTDEMVETALRTTQYGKCVFKCDNDVVDHQTVNMIFEDDITVTFTMNAFNKGGRFIHIMGTKGELHAAMDGLGTPITIYEFETKQTTEIPIVAKDGITNGHGGGDDGIVYSLYEYLTGEYQGFSVSDIRTSVNNHLIVFAAEESRANGTVVDFDTFVENLR